MVSVVARFPGQLHIKLHIPPIWQFHGHSTLLLISLLHLSSRKTGQLISPGKSNHLLWLPHWCALKWAHWLGKQTTQHVHASSICVAQVLALLQWYNVQSLLLQHFFTRSAGPTHPESQNVQRAYVLWVDNASFFLFRSIVLASENAHCFESSYSWNFSALLLLL